MGIRKRCLRNAEATGFTVSDRFPSVLFLQVSRRWVYYRHPDYLIYADPPYPLSTRTYNLYPDEMTDEDHLALLEALDRHPGPVVLSSYGCPLYDERLAYWQRVSTPSVAEGAQARTEVLWLNHQAQHEQLAMWPETTREVLR